MLKFKQLKAKQQSRPILLHNNIANPYVFASGTWQGVVNSLLE